MRILRRGTIWLLSLVFLLVIASAVVLVMEITVDIGAMKPAAESAASRAIGRPVRIAGDIKLTPGLFSAIEVTDVTVGEESSAEASGFARVGRARLSVGVIPLLEGRVQVKDVLAERVVVNFGDDLLQGRAPAPSASPAAQTTGRGGESGLMFEEVADLVLRDVVLDAPHPSPIVERLEVRLSELEGSAARGQPLDLHGTGRIQGQPLEVAVQGGSLEDLFRLKFRWPVSLEAALGSTRVVLTRADSAPSTSPSPPPTVAARPDSVPGSGLDYSLSLEGERLDDLDRLVGVSLPPLGPYSVAGLFQVTEERVGVHRLDIRVRESSLAGDLVWMDTVEPQKIDVGLEAGRLQLDDFDVGDWSALRAGEKLSGRTDTDSDVGGGYRVPKAMLDPAVMRAFDVDLKLEVKEVVSGSERWGAGRLGAKAADGRLVIDPLHVELPGGPIDLVAVFEPVEHVSLAAAHLWPVQVRGEAGGARLELKRVLGEPAAPADATGGQGGAKLLEYELKASGDKLDDFNGLAEVSLPPWGPYAIEGRLLAFENRLDIRGLALRVGESDLSGDFSLQLGTAPPRLDIDLETKLLQLDDFEVGDWSPFADAQPADTPVAGSTGAASSDTKSDEAMDVEALLSRPTLARAEGGLSLRVGRVSSGKDVLGAGELKLTLDKARLELKPLRLAIPGGSIEIAAHYEPGEADFATGLDVRVERFDYGVLARRLDPEIDQSGRISLDIDLDTRAGRIDDLLTHATGRFDFAVWPETIEADVFDLWVVNLFTAVNASVDEAQSKVNCVVGVFDITDGLMKSRSLFADTTRMQVRGEGEVDFKSGELSLRARPRPKKAEFFSAATPVEVSGNIEQFKVALPPGAEIETIVRMTTSVVTTPIARLLEQPLPADGEAACEEAFRRGS